MSYVAAVCGKGAEVNEVKEQLLQSNPVLEGRIFCVCVCACRVGLEGRVCSVCVCVRVRACKWDSKVGFSVCMCRQVGLYCRCCLQGSLSLWHAGRCCAWGE